MNNKNIMSKELLELKSKIIELTTEYSGEITHENLMALFMSMSAEIFAEGCRWLKTREAKEIEIQSFISKFSYHVRYSIKSLSEEW